MRRALAFFLLFACLALHAQKARPLAIPLKEGEGAAQGHLRGRQQMEYEVTVPGQTITLAMTAAPLRSLTLKVYDPEGAEITLQRVGAGRWTATLPKPGTYGVTILRTGSAPGKSRFRLTVATH